ncbi:MAG TPA: hypothetical protein ENN24_02815 [Bacteroidetes bacterium]|nr:hypothetical protein [Bacteroidota bacterium]
MNSVDMLAEQEVVVESGEQDNFLLLSKGKPISEPVVKFGPLVVNTPHEIQ